MSDSMDDITCETCIAACCRAPINMTLSAVEFKRNKKTMNLREVAKPKLYPQRIEIPARAADDGTPQTRFVETPGGYGLYELESGCDNLDKNDRCSIYQTRPACCREFELRSPMCLMLRREAGLDADRPELVIESTTEVVPPTPLERLRAQIFPSIGAEPIPSPPQPVPTALVRAAPLGMSDLTDVIMRESRSVSAQLSRLEDSQWNIATGCAGWDIGDVASHLVTGHRFTSEILAAVTDSRPINLETAIELRHESFGIIVAAFAHEHRTLSAQLSAMTPEFFKHSVEISGESVTVRHILHVLALELAVHGSDIAAALGETRRFNSDSAQAMAAVLARLLDEGDTPAEGAAYVLRSEAFELPLTWRAGTWNLEASQDPCWIEGSANDVLLFALGRQSFETLHLVTNDPDRARDFKRYLLGP